MWDCNPREICQSLCNKTTDSSCYAERNSRKHGREGEMVHIVSMGIGNAMAMRGGKETVSLEITTSKYFKRSPKIYVLYIS